jgi:hypothetical protein
MITKPDIRKNKSEFLDGRKVQKPCVTNGAEQTAQELVIISQNKYSLLPFYDTACALIRRRLNSSHGNEQNASDPTGNMAT